MTLGLSPRSCDPSAVQHKRDDGPRPQSDPPPQRGTMEASRPESAAARLERERDFHNARFEHDARDAQLKYYDAIADCFRDYWARVNQRSEAHTSELQSLLRLSYAVFSFKKKH